MYIPLIKTIVGILAVIELWLLLQIPAIGDAVFSFVVGGELPWSDRVLSLRQMGLLLTGLFVLAAGLIFRREISNGLNSLGRPGRPLAAVPQPQVPLSAVHHQPTEPVVVVPSAPVPVKQPGRFRTRLARAAVALQGLRRVATYRAKIVALAVYRAAVWTCAMEVYLLYRLWLLVSGRSVQFWRWSRPYLERFDHWIGRKLRKNERAADILSIGNEVVITVKEWFVWFRSVR
jgi:hypothetical protein